MASSSLPSSIVNLMKTMIGFGVLCIPFVFGQTGLLLGITVLLLCALAQAFALHLLALSVLQAHKRRQDVSFHSLSQGVFGGRQIGSTMVSVCLVTFSFAGAVGNLIVIGDLLPEVSGYFGVDSSPWNSRLFWMTAIGWFVELPLSCFANLDSLKISSTIGLVGIMYIVILVCIFASGGISLPSPQQVISVWPPAHSSHTSTPGMIESLPIFLSAFACAVNVPTLVLELGETTMLRVDAMIVIAVALTTAIYMLVGICGGLAFGASVAGNSLKSFPNEQGTGAGLVSIFARVAIVFNSIGGFPLYMHPLRAVILQVFSGKASSALGFPARASFTLALFILLWGLALAIPGLDDVLAFVGSTAVLLVGFLFPALFYCLGGRGHTEGDFGVSLPENGEPAQGCCLKFCRNQGSLRKAAAVMVVVSCALIPVCLGGEVLKILNES